MRRPTRNILGVEDHQASSRQVTQHHEDKANHQPDITFFGQKLDSKFPDHFKTDREVVDLLVIIGTSLKVAPVSEVCSGSLSREMGAETQHGYRILCLRSISTRLPWPIIHLTWDRPLGCGSGAEFIDLSA